MRDVGHQGRRRAAASPRRRSTGASTATPLAARELPPRAPDAQPAAPRQGEGHRGRRSMSHHALRARPPAAAAQRAGGAGLPAAACSPRRSTSEADYVFLDLEDAVAPADKEQARLNVIAALLEHDWRGRRQDDHGADQRHRHPLHVPRRGGRRGAGGPPARHRCSSPRSACRPTSTWWTRCSPRSRTAKGIPHRIGIDVLIETALGMANVEAIAQSSRRLEAMHFGVADYAASCRARTVNIGGLNPDYPGDQWHVALSRMIVACRAYGLRADRRPVRRLQGPRGLPAGGPAGRGARHRGQVGDPPVADRARQRGVHAAAGRGGPGPADPRGAGRGGARGQGRGAARRPDDRRGVGADGAERGGDGGGDRRQGRTDERRGSER